VTNKNQQYTNNITCTLLQKSKRANYKLEKCQEEVEAEVEEGDFMENQVLHHCQEGKIQNIKSQSLIRTTTLVLPNKHQNIKLYLNFW
jgi:hypothetical protein